MYEYYKSVETEIEVPSGGEGKRKSVLAELKAKKAEVAKQPRKRRSLDNNRNRYVYSLLEEILL